MRDLVPPTRFELLDCIGRGGIAEVYRANQVGLRGFRRRVAVKVLRPDLIHDERHRERLINEARLGATLDHPNIVRTLDLIFVDGNPAIVLDLIDGHDLFELLSCLTRNKVDLPIELGVHIALEVLSGLSHAIDTHGPALVHGDVTPGNIMVSRHGDVCLIDFGVASANIAAAMRGKPGYLSPEIVRGEAPDHRSDLFSLATTLWESLTLKRLFAHSDDTRTLDNILNVRVNKRFARAKHVPADLLEILRTALAPDPSDRFQTAREFGRALRDWLVAQRLVVTRQAVADFLARHGPVRQTTPSAMEPPPLPASRLDISGLEEAIAALDNDPTTSTFSALARGHLDDRLARLTSETPVVGSDRHAYTPLGLLDPVTIPAILTAIWRFNLTGALGVVDGNRRKVLFFADGGVVHISSNIEAELLGHRLADAGLIPENFPDIAMRYAQARSIRVGEALVELQATTPEALSKALDQQLAARFIDLLSWTEGRLTFESNRRPDLTHGEAERAQLDTLTLVLRGLRETWSDARIAELIAPLTSATLSWTASRMEVSRALFLGVSDDQRLMSLDDGQRLGDRAPEGGAMRFLIVALIALGFLRLA